jgi:peroxygenase
MVSLISSMSPRSPFNFTRNDMDIDDFKSIDAGEEDGGFNAHSKPEYDTLIKEGREKTEAIDWISGVGDVCNYGTKVKTRPRRKKSISAQQRSPKEMQTTDSQCNTIRKRSALQRHCDFWDADGDGLIYPWDIYTGFRRLGFNVILCVWAAVTMAICSSYSTQTSWLPHPLFAINIDNINCCRHGSTTATYDMDSEIDMRRFHAIFDKYADGKDYLTWRSLYDVWSGQCSANDWFGWFAGGLECKCS